MTRTIGTDARWSAVIWSDLTADDADEVIAEQITRSAGSGPLEWKLYSHDRPGDLPGRLKAAGLQPEPVGTTPAWRGRGVFRALVGHRAALARDRGFRYLQADAMPASRPILQRMGFHPLAETTPWMYEG